jgi:hypothetical protein
LSYCGTSFQSMRCFLTPLDNYQGRIHQSWWMCFAGDVSSSVPSVRVKAHHPAIPRTWDRLYMCYFAIETICPYKENFHIWNFFAKSSNICLGHSFELWGVSFAGALSSVVPHNHVKLQRPTRPGSKVSTPLC